MFRANIELEIHQNSSKFSIYTINDIWEKRSQGMRRLQRGGLLKTQKGLPEIGKGDCPESTSASAISPNREPLWTQKKQYVVQCARNTKPP